MNDLIVTPHPLSLEGRTVHTAVELRPGEHLDGFLARAGVQGDGWVATIGGAQVPQAAWRWVTPKHGQVIEARRVAGRDVVRAIAFIAVAYLAIQTGAYFGGMTTFSGFAAATAVTMVGSALVNRLLPPSVARLKTYEQQTGSTYAIAGGRNRARPFEPLGLVLGTVRVVPDYAALPYSWFEGEDQYQAVRLHGGINAGAATLLKIGSTDIDDYEDVEVTRAGFPGVADTLDDWAAVDTIAGGALTAETAPGPWVTRTTSTNTVRIAVDLVAQLISVADDGGLFPASTPITMQRRLLPSGAWEPLIIDNETVTFQSRSTKPVRRTYVTEALTAGQYEVRMRKGEADVQTTRQTNIAEWSTLKSYQADNGSYADYPQVGVRIKATGQLTGVLDELNWLMAQRTRPVWNGSAWVNQATSNPGAHILLLARGIYDEDGRLQAGMGLADEQIDIEALKAFMVHCATNGYRFDQWYDESLGCGEMMEAIAAAGLGSISYHTGRLGVVWAAPSQPIEAVIGMGNIRRASFSVDYAARQVADEVEVAYLDRNADWVSRTVRIKAPGVTMPRETARLAPQGVTTRDGALLMGRWAMAQNVYQRQLVSWEMDAEFVTFRRMSVVALSHDLTQWGYSGRLHGAVNTAGVVTIELDAEVPFNASASARAVGLRIPGEAGYRVFTIQPFSGTARALTLVEAWPSGVPFPGAAGNPAYDTLWIYDFRAQPGRRLRVTEVAPGADLRSARISAVVEEDAFWTFVTSGAYTQPPAPATREPVVVSNIGIARERNALNYDLATTLTVTFDVTGPFDHAEVWGAPEGSALQFLGTTRTNSFEGWRVAATGEVVVQVRAFDQLGRPAVAVSATFDLALDLPIAGESALLVRNGGFEAGQSSGWVPVFPTAAAIEADTATASSGQWRLRISVRDGVARSAFENRVFPVVAGQQFTLQGRALAASGTNGNAFIRINWEDSSAAVTYSTISWTAAEAAGAYLGKVAVFTAPAGAVQARVQIGQFGQTTGHWYLDDIACQVGGGGGTDATAYWLARSAASVVFDPAGAGSFVPPAVTFSAYSATGAAAPAAYAGRYIIATSTDGTTFTNAYTSAANESSKTFTLTAGIKALRVRLYLAGGTSTLLDEEIVPVLIQGSNGLTPVLSNGAHTLPAASDGTVVTYAGSGTTLQVFDGSTALTFHTTLAAGRFVVGTPTVSPAAAITVGARSGSGTTICTVADHGAMSNAVDACTITYPVTARRADGTDVAFNLVQTLGKSKAGADGATGVLVDNGGFESGPSVGWVAADATGAAIENDAANASSGNWRLRITVTDAVARVAYRNKQFPVVPGERYTLSARVKSNGAATGSGFVRIMWQYASGSPTYGVVTWTPAETSSGYVGKSVSFEAPSGAVSGLVQVGQSGQNSGSWFIDDIVCQAVGADGAAYWLTRSAAALSRDPRSGAYTPPSLTFGARFVEGGNSPAAYAGRFIIATSTDGVSFTTQYTSAADESSKAYTVPAGISALRVQLFRAGGTTTLLDEEIVPVVTDGTHALTPVLSNAAHTVQAGSDGVVVSYSGSGTTLQVFEGSTALTFHTTLAAGRFVLGTPTVSPAGVITVGARSGSGTTTCTVADHSAMSAGVDVATITYPVTARRADGTDVSFSLVQTVGKAKAGATATAYWLGRSAASVVFDPQGGTYMPASVTFSGFSATGTGAPAAYAGRFIIATSTDGSTFTTAYTSAANESSRAFAVPAGVVAIRARLFLAGGTTTLLDEEIVPVVTQGSNGLTPVLSNGSHALPSASNGVVSSYTGSGTTIRVFEGSTALQFNTTLAAGRFTVGTPTISPAGTISVGARSGSGTTTCTVAAHSGADSAEDVITITYPITARRADGTDVALQLVQTLTKSKAGVDGESGLLVDNGGFEAGPTVAWSVVDSTTGAFIESDAATANTGNWRLRMAVTDGISRAPFGNKVFPAAPGQLVELIARVRSATGTSGQAFVRIRWLDVAGDPVFQTITWTPAETLGAYLTKRLILAAPAGAVTGRVEVGQLGQTLGTWYVDDIICRPAGADSTAYWLGRSAASVVFDPQAGTYTPASITFNGYSSSGANAPAGYAGRFVIATSTDGSTFTTQYTSSANESSRTYAVPTGVVAIRARLYLAGGTTTLLDEEIVPVVTQGSNGLTPVLSNSAHSLPATNSGSVTSYTGSGTTIRVFEGSTALQFNTTLAPGRFTVGTPTVSPVGDITVGARSGSGTTTCTVAAHSAADATAEVISITYPITARRADGTDVALQLVQTLTKGKAGRPALVASYQGSNDGPVSYSTVT